MLYLMKNTEKFKIRASNCSLPHKIHSSEYQLIPLPVEC